MGTAVGSPCRRGPLITHSPVCVWWKDVPNLVLLGRTLSSQELLGCPRHLWFPGSSETSCCAHLYSRRALLPLYPSSLLVDSNFLIAQVFLFSFATLHQTFVTGGI